MSSSNSRLSVPIMFHQRRRDPVRGAMVKQQRRVYKARKKITTLRRKKRQGQPIHKIG